MSPTYFMPEVDPLILTFSWDPDIEPPDKFVRRVVAAATGTAKEYVKHVQGDLAPLSDWRPRRQTRQREAHALRWLAEYQVGRRSYASIHRDNLNLHVSGIREAIKSAALQIDLPLRPRIKPADPK